MPAVLSLLEIDVLGHRIELSQDGKLDRYLAISLEARVEPIEIEIPDLLPNFYAADA